MLMIDDQGHKWLQQLSSELLWLESTHPEMTALIALARGHFNTIKMASSHESLVSTAKTLREAIELTRGGSAPIPRQGYA